AAAGAVHEAELQVDPAALLLPVAGLGPDVQAALLRDLVDPGGHAVAHVLHDPGGRFLALVPAADVLLDRALGPGDGLLPGLALRHRLRSGLHAGRRRQRLLQVVERSVLVAVAVGALPAPAVGGADAPAVAADDDAGVRAPAPALRQVGGERVGGRRGPPL